MKWLVPFTFLMVFETIGNYLSGLFGSIQNLLLIPLALVIYAVANYFWLIALKNGSGLAKGTIYFGVAVVILTALIGFIFYEEAVTLFKLIGMGIGITSLVLLSDRPVKH